MASEENSRAKPDEFSYELSIDQLLACGQALGLLKLEKRSAFSSNRSAMANQLSYCGHEKHLANLHENTLGP